MLATAETFVENSVGDSDASVKSVSLRIELGSTEISPDRLAELDSGKVVALDQAARDPVMIYANDRLIALGELILHQGRLCVRITERIFAETP